MTEKIFDETMLKQLDQRGISATEGQRQLNQLRQGHAFLPLDRPCTLNDGLVPISPKETAELCRLFDTAAISGRFTRFVPASGAASRMFAGLFPAALDSKKAGRIRACLNQFPFYPELTQLTELLPEDLDDSVLFSLLLEADGLHLAGKPKGLLPLHHGKNYNRTAFAEHLFEGIETGIHDFHFTVSPEHQPLFQQHLDNLTDKHSAFADVSVSFSLQSPQTDTIALDLETELPFLSQEGELLFRPAGHGALLSNLEKCGGDLALIRNIDNVVPEKSQECYRRWAKILGGKLAALQQQVFAIIEQLSTKPDVSTIETASQFLAQTFGRRLSSDTQTATETAAQLIKLLDRPIRVCGMVPVSGQPGGGPFWTRDALGQISPQIVEGVQIDPDNQQQQELLAASTHFNPVNIACSLRDRNGTPYRLSDFVDEEAAIITRKNASGRELLALERPGLWNGAMSGWNTLFIEMPAETFNPIKTVFDLLKPAHRVE